MISIKDKHDCCGCEACVQICPKHCITFDEDNEGFRYPNVIADYCIECSLCEKVCPVININEAKAPIHIYAAKNKNEGELLRSSSGGLFIILAKKTISDGGVVFGAKFDENWNVVHSYAEDYDGIKAFMQSKYVQSRIGKTYSMAQAFLKSGRKVLFTGTSCQIAGLKNYLCKDYDNLLTVDVICHGVPSPMVWRRYLDEINNDTRASQIKNISFRDKRLGWKKYCFALTLSKNMVDGKENTISLSHIYREDAYMQLFLSNLILRPSCFNCKVKGGRSLSDVTIADFWKIDKLHPDFYDKRGVGLLIVNTLKGHRSIDWDSISFIESISQNVIASNPVYARSVKEPQKRAECFRLINTTDRSIKDLCQQMLSVPLFVKIGRKLMSIKRKLFRVKY